VERIKVLFLAAEAAPFIKVGGLGDVAGSLPSALRSLPDPVDVRLTIPFYEFLDLEGFPLKPAASFTIHSNQGEILAETYRTRIKDLPVYLIKGEPVSASQTVYSDDGYRDGRKFTFFSLGAMELARSLTWHPDVIHAHDWHTSPAVYNLGLIRGRDDYFLHTRSLLTVHNLPYLGYGAEKALNEFGLPPAEGSPLPDWAQSLPLPLGLLSADQITTVSGGYAKEILTPGFGAGLDGFLRTRAEDIHGILNGLDMKVWDPSSDTQIEVQYGIGDWEGREGNKTALLTEMGLAQDVERPLLAMINRMDTQKGVDLVPGALRSLEDMDWQAVILGTGDPALETEVARLDEEMRRVRSIIRYDTGLARRIYAGADMILIPSRYEPCGLTQMIAMRYGCVPVARATGGLRDTIDDYHAEPTPYSTGFLFREATSAALAHALRRALTVYGDKRRWRGLQRRGMKADFSWQRSAEEYVGLYEELVRR
jgi:starch synthase